MQAANDAQKFRANSKFQSDWIWQCPNKTHKRQNKRQAHVTLTHVLALQDDESKLGHLDTLATN